MRLPPIQCSCSALIVKSDKEVKIRSKIMLVKDEGVFAVCKGCGEEIKVPLKVDDKALYPPLFIKKYK